MMMPYNWIGQIKLTDEDELSVDGEKIHDLLEQNDFGGDIIEVDENTHPVLYNKIPPVFRKRTYVVCASTRPQYFLSQDFRDTTLFYYQSLYGHTYSKGIGLFLDNRSNSPTTLSIEGIIDEIVPFLEGGIKMFFNNDESSSSRSFFFVTITSDTGNVIQIRLNEWGSSLDALVRYNGAKAILFNTSETRFIITWYLKDGVLTNDNNGLSYDTGGFIPVSAYCECYADDLGLDAVQELSVEAPAIELPNMTPPTGSTKRYKIIADAVEGS